MLLPIVGDAARKRAKTLSLAAAVPPPVLVGTDASTGVAATFAVVEMTTMTTIPPAPPFCPVIRPASAATRIARIRASEYCEAIHLCIQSITHLLITHPTPSLMSLSIAGAAARTNAPTKATPMISLILVKRIVFTKLTAARLLVMTEEAAMTK